MQTDMLWSAKDNVKLQSIPRAKLITQRPLQRLQLQHILPLFCLGIRHAISSTQQKQSQQNIYLQLKPARSGQNKGEMLLVQIQDTIWKSRMLDHGEMGPGTPAPPTRAQKRGF